MILDGLSDSACLPFSRLASGQSAPRPVAISRGVRRCCSPVPCEGCAQNPAPANSPDQESPIVEASFSVRDKDAYLTSLDLHRYTIIRAVAIRASYRHRRPNRAPVLGIAERFFYNSAGAVSLCIACDLFLLTVVLPGVMSCERTSCEFDGGGVFARL